MNTKTKGDIAIGQAIAYYTKCGYEICLPIGDKKSYDFILDKGGNLLKVQCKYTSYKRGGGPYQVPLRVLGGNRSFHTAKRYSKEDFDILFVCTEQYVMYEIPFNEVLSKTYISLGEKCNKYIVR